MDYNVSYQGPQDFEVNSNIHKNHGNFVGISEVDLILNTEFAVSRIHEIHFDNFYIRYGHSQIGYNKPINFQYKGESIDITFVLNGSYDIHSKSSYRTIYNRKNTHNITYNNNLEGYVNWLEEKCLIFEMSISPSFFMKYLLENQGYNNFINNIVNQNSATLSKTELPITPAMRCAINKIMKCQYKENFKKLFIESQVLNLILLQLEQIEFLNLKTSTRSELLLKNISEQMFYAKELIENNQKSPLSLAQLASELNTNECSLKKNFKATFGTTVFGYLMQLKMEKAKKILLNTTLSVKEVSSDLGYQNPQHFSLAFKKYWGITPSQIK